MQKKLSDENNKKTFKKLICKKYSIEKSAVKKFVVTKFVVIEQFVVIYIDMQQNQNEIIKQYYQRIHDVFFEIDHKNILLFVVVFRNWIDDFNNKKLTRHMINKSMKKQNLYHVCIIAKRKLLQKHQKKKIRKTLQQQFQNIVDREIVRIQIFYEFLHFLKQIRSEILKICTVVNITNIEIFAFIVSKYIKWIIVFTNLQKSSFEICFVNEFSFILKKMSCDLSEINTNIVNFNDIESIDEIFVSKFDKWIVFVKIKIFDFTNTFANFAKNSFAFDIESTSNISFDWNRCCIVDIKILNQKVFVLIVTYDAFSKNSFALFFENLKISIAMNMSFFKHFMNMNDSVIETFDFDIVMNAFSKNSSIQHIENSKTLKKNSIYIFYELFAFSVFDFNIDIDFQIYTIDIETFSFDWNRCCIDFIEFNIFSTSICIFVSIVNVIISNVIFEIMNAHCYEKKQMFCSTMYFSVSTIIECTTVMNTNFYEEKQFCFLVDTNAICIVVVVVNIDASILIVDLINMMKNFVRMSFFDSVVNLISKSKYKKLSKMKIKII